MARKSKSRRSTGSRKMGSFLKRSEARGAKLISLRGKRYHVRGVKTSFARFGNAKRAANKLAYAGSAKRRGKRRSKR